MFIACSTLVTVLFLPDFFKGNRLGPISGIVRPVAMLAVFILGAIFLLSMQVVENARYPPQWPPADAKHSMLLLPAACYLDPDPKPYSYLDANATAYLGEGELARSKRQQVPFALGCALAVLFVFGFFGQFLFYILNARGDSSQRYNSSPKASNPRKTLVTLIWTLSWITCLGIASYSAHYIIYIRRWVDRSGWLAHDERGRNPKNGIYGVGQLLPLIQLVAVFFD